MSVPIEWRHDGRRIILPVLVLRPAPVADLTGFEGTALIDTGATASGITPRVARALSLAPRGKRPLGSARGEEQAERYLFRIGLLPPPAPEGVPRFPFVFDDVIGFELGEAFALDLLIGMDILSQCTFRIDPQRSCELIAG